MSTPKVPAKFYHANRTNGFVIGPGDRKFSFASYKLFGGTWRGVYFSEDAEEQAVLDAMVADPKTGITVITQAEYEDKLKKKAPFVKDLKPLEPVVPQAPPAAVAAVVEAASASEEAAKEKPVEVPEAEALETGPVRQRGKRNGKNAAAAPETPPAE